MTPLFSLPLTVAPVAIDDNDHVNNVVYVQWMQDAASAHADQAGYGVARCLELGGTWVVRCHNIEYLTSARLGDRLRLDTWIGDIGRCGCQRRYRFVRETDARILARASSHYVYIGNDSLRPQALPAALLDRMALLVEGPAD